jgi:formamidopyrimidine-DNA glycosylase
VEGKIILRAERRAKNIFIYLNSGKVIWVHLKMTGHFLFGDYFYDKKKKNYKPRDG